jgi:lantibiotic modifying enzyme
MDCALAAAAQIDDAAIAADRGGDVLAGSPGAVLGLLALHRSVPSTDVLERAVAAGRHVLAHQPGLTSERLTGFAHGASGVAVALLRLAGATGDDAFRCAAVEQIEFERHTHDHRTRNWPDFRWPMAADGTRPCSTMWCHGAPGIGLARLAALTHHDDARYGDEIETALATTAEYGLRDADHLCCGNFGRLDLFVEAGQRLARPGLRRRAAAAATTLLERRRLDGGLRLACDSAPVELKPSLFRGAAGVGYELLRITAPADLPTVLTWS